MAGIQVHTESPISDNSPQTTAARPDTSTAGSPGHRNTPASIPATTTATSTSNYTPAQPGIAAVPAPTSTATGFASSTMIPTRTVPPPVTNTGISNDPAPPQPGQAPSPYSYSSYSVQSPIPPPPRAGQVASPSTTASVPPMQTNTTTAFYPPPSSSTYSSASVDLSHPPGYSQNVRGTFEDRIPADNSTPSRSVAGGILDSNPSSYLASGIGRREQAGTGLDEGESMWDTAAKWAKAAGQKLSDGEQQIWKMVNGPDK